MAQVWDTARRGVFRALFAAAALAAASPVFAQADKTARVDSAPALPAWIVTCTNGNAEAAFRCAMQQTLYVAATRQRIMAITIEKAASGLTATLLLPHGIDFSKGVAYQIDDGKSIQTQIVSADQNGSYATIALSKEMVAALRIGKVFRVTAKPVTGDDLVIELSLTGFTDALAILERN